mmetsp:Transcript_20349/g.42839  ORF Transcript_20349/g.42839 Transcript_20349/m.42839 type:complete len:103 (-) Transcript_20349:221-529(-)
MHTHENHIHRLMSLVAMQTLSKSLSPIMVHQHVLPVVINLSTDPVPNIRFNVAKTLQSLATQVDAPVVSSDIQPCLSSMIGDDDRDVKYFANCALVTLVASA